jgi:hypothetical protein
VERRLELGPLPARVNATAHADHGGAGNRHCHRVPAGQAMQPCRPTHLASFFNALPGEIRIATRSDRNRLLEEVALGPSEQATREPISLRREG